MDDSRQFNDEGRGIWNQKAAFWNNLFGETGNRFHKTLVGPSVERLLDLKSGERVLDIACGNGVMARRMAQLGGIVTATDFSAEFIELAKSYPQTGAHPIDYHVVDATDETALVALGAGQFDAITCTMALMDIPDIKPLFRAVSHLLKPQGRFVFATMHPAFNSNNPIFGAEEADNAGQIITTHYIKIMRYLEMPPIKGAGAIGEPVPHYYYHRPLHELLGAGFDAGLVLDALEEPSFTPTPEELANARALSWLNYGQFPAVLAGRFCLK